MMKTIIILVITSLSVTNINSQVISEWRGIGRKGIYNEKGLLEKRPEKEHEMLWPIDSTPKGYSSAAVANNTIYFTGIKDSDDYLLAVDNAGKIKWQVPYGRSWMKSFPNSRSTPAIKKGSAYVSSGNGDIACVNTKSGKIIWSVKASEKFEGTLKLVWTDSILDVHHGGVVSVDGYIYEANWINNRNDNWCCIDGKTRQKKV